MNKKITYAQVGDNYDTKDPVNKMSQVAARETAKNLKKTGFEEVEATRGESAFVWKQGKIYMASVIECLGTKNLIASEMRKITSKTYFDAIAQDTIATVINDLTTVGAKPLTLSAFWAVEDNSFLEDKKLLTDFITGWRDACNASGVTWGGGETATSKGVIEKGSINLGGSAVGIIKSKKRLLIDTNLKSGDQILFLKSNGVNANGISLTRTIAKKLPKGYGTLMNDGVMYGEALLSKSNLYAKLVQDLLDAGIELHYIANITGHGLRKIMRARASFRYVIDKIFDPQEVFLFIQEHAGLDDYEMYQTYNMGQDYALFLPEKHIQKAQKIIAKHKFKSIHAGYIEKGKKEVVIKPKNLTYKGETLNLR